MSDFDWNQLRGFLATAETGSLSAAARKLGLTQPTLGRQVAAFEQALGVTLFERVGKQLHITSTGLDLLEHARTMGAAADALSLAATGRAQAIKGIVSVSVSDSYAAYVLPPIIKTIRKHAPSICLEVLVTNTISDLRRREADIAIRHIQPTEPELIATLVRNTTASYYASEAWIAQHGLPETASDVAHHDFIGFERAAPTAQMQDYIGLSLNSENYSAISENSVTNWALARQGLGYCIMSDEIAAHFPDMRRILKQMPPINFPLWLVTHRELRTSRKIRLVYDLLAKGLAKPRLKKPPLN